MTPRRLEVRAERFALHTPFRISRGVKDAADVVTVSLAQGGRVGRGEGVPYPRYGETVAQAVAAVEAIGPAIERGLDRAALGDAMPAGAARNAVDCALWDLDGQRGAPPPGLVRAVATALTVGLDTPEAMAAAAAALAGAPLLKVKVDRAAPVAQVAAVRVAAPGARLIVDPNESWTADTLRAVADDMAALGVALLEQPLPAGADHALSDIACPVPVCADESLHTRADLPALAGRYTHVNVKLDKTGGLTEALALAAEARARGFGVMVGCMICSSLSIAPALVLAADADFVDLDGPLWLAADRAGGVRAADGLLLPPAPGFWGGR